MMHHVKNMRTHRRQVIDTDYLTALYFVQKNISLTLGPG